MVILVGALTIWWNLWFFTWVYNPIEIWISPWLSNLKNVTAQKIITLITWITKFKQPQLADSVTEFNIRKANPLEPRNLDHSGRDRLALEWKTQASSSPLHLSISGFFFIDIRASIFYRNRCLFRHHQWRRTWKMKTLALERRFTAGQRKATCF